MNKELKARIFTVKDFYKHIKITVENLPNMRKANKSKRVDKAFQEKIMLAVTQVNGCRFCNYIHTKNAIDAGASEEEINAMLNGELGDIHNDESLALMFAQHYADKDGDYDLETYRKIEAHYGKDKAHDILTNIQVIMSANIHGIAVDALQSRFRGQKMQGSKLSQELGIALGIVLIIPTAFIHTIFEKIGAKKS